MSVVLLDTGPLVAYCRANEVAHEWAVGQLDSLKPPLLTCEPVITEAVYLLAAHGRRADLVWEFMRAGMLKVAFSLESDFEAVATLLRRYVDLPMDLADACLVRMSEQHRDCRVLTTDADFRIYRRFGRQVIPLISPFNS